MKRIIKTKRENFNSIHLFLDDIKEIVRILEDINDIKVLLLDKEYQYDSINELLERKGSTINYIKIVTSNNNIGFEVEKKGFLGGVTLYVYVNDKEYLYAFNEISEILKKRQSFLNRIFNPKFCLSVLPILFIVLVLFFGLASLFFSFSLPITKYEAVLFMTLYFFVFSISFFVSLGKFSTINLIPRHQKLSFIQRNKDELLVGLIIAVIGTIAGYLLKTFTG